MVTFHKYREESLVSNRSILPGKLFFHILDVSFFGSFTYERRTCQLPSEFCAGIARCNVRYSTIGMYSIHVYVLTFRSRFLRDSTGAFDRVKTMTRRFCREIASTGDTKMRRGTGTRRKMSPFFRYNQHKRARSGEEGLKARG